VANQPWQVLKPYLASAVTDSSATLQKLQHYAALIVQWNRNVSNLVSKNDEARIVSRHIRESIEPIDRVNDFRDSRLIDFGSGAGFPAIPLAISGIGKDWTLIESRRPKTLFLRRVIQEIGLDPMQVVHDRLENFVADTQTNGTYDVFTSRATLALGPTLGLAKELVRSNGAALLWKGSSLEEEMDSDQNWRDSWTLGDIIRLTDTESVVARFIRK